jgi:4-diphosphocytidyl-2-C-methyl-D-erythritol kinase
LKIVRAYAKINIGLRILGKRPDGYHNIETIFHQIDLYDELSLLPCDTIKLSSSSAEIPCDSSNLCVRAADLLRSQTGHSDGIHITLTKRIPVGSGLGGGSSDAATVLIALNDQWRLGIPQEKLVWLAASLGSDVPFFLRGGTALGTSRGEVLDYFKLRMPYWILTATPDIHISTAWAYSNVRLKPANGAPALRKLVEQTIDSPEQLRAGIYNDFQGAVFQHYPRVAQLAESLTKAGAVFSQLSGSGSSVFGFFQSQPEAQQAERMLGPTCVTSLTAPDFQPIQISQNQTTNN